MNPLVSWTVAIGFIAAASYYYSQTGKKPPVARARSVTASEGAPVPPKPKKEQKAKRKPEHANSADHSGSDAPFSSAREQSDLSAAEGASKRKSNRGKTQPNVQTPAAVPGKKPNNDKDDSADAAWAEQMASVRKGTNLSVPTSNAARQRTVKTSSLESGAAPAAAAVSSAGAQADEDDDLSPVASPGQKAGDVSDMLEPRAPGPSVLRLTEPAQPMPQRAPRQQKEVEPAETKRQRQNKRKNEERKALVQEQEKERQALLEAQRRQAREARGEPARNGLQSAPAPANRAWTPEKSAAPAVQPMEDIVDRAKKPAVGNAQVSIMPAEPKETKGWSNGMSEAEAIERATRASEDESGWATVETKKGKKGHGRGASDVAAAPETKPQAPELAPKKNLPAAVQQPQKITNGFASLDTSIDAGSHPDDSEWGA